MAARPGQRLFYTQGPCLSSLLLCCTFFCYHGKVMSHFSSLLRLLGLGTLFLYPFSYFNLHFYQFTSSQEVFVDIFSVFRGVPDELTPPSTLRD